MFRIQERSGIPFHNILYLTYNSDEMHDLLNLDVISLPIGEDGLTMSILSKSLTIFSTRPPKIIITDADLKTTTESRYEKRARKNKERRMRKQQQKMKKKRSRRKN